MSPAVNAFGALALDATVVQVRDYLDTVETKLQTLIDRPDSTSSNQATEIVRLTEIRDRLAASLDADGGIKVHQQNITATQPVSGSVTMLNPTTNPETGLATSVKQDTENEYLRRKFGDAAVPGAVRVTAAGATVIRDTPAGKKLRLLWIGLSSSQDNTVETLVQIKIGSKVIRRWNMGNPGAFANSPMALGDNLGDDLIVDLSIAQNVEVNYTYEEI